MAYATLTQLIEAYGITELSQLLADENNQVSEVLLKDAMAENDLSNYSQAQQTAIEAAIMRAENVLERQSVFINSKISGRYSLPLQNTVDSPVVECCLALARAALADDGANIAKRIIEERDYWRKWLNDVAKGDAQLPGENASMMGGSEKNFISKPPRSSIDWSTY